jgi:hypothetical protein
VAGGRRFCAVFCIAVATVAAGCEANPNTGTAAPVGAQSPAAAVPLLARFHNLSTDAVAALVGEPDFRRVEPPAELWQYRTEDCVVDLFFYGDGKDRRVVLADARGRDHPNDQHCKDGSKVLGDRLRVKSP